MISRRHLLTGLIAAPAVIAYHRLMPVDAALTAAAADEWQEIPVQIQIQIKFIQTENGVWLPDKKLEPEWQRAA